MLDAPGVDQRCFYRCKNLLAQEHELSLSFAASAKLLLALSIYSIQCKRRTLELQAVPPLKLGWALSVSRATDVRRTIVIRLFYGRLFPKRRAL